MRVIEKKCWPEFFELIVSGKKNVEYRLADFDAKQGDIIVLKEWDPEANQYSGREIRKRISNINRINPLKFHNKDQIERHGAYIIEMESV